MVGRLAGHKVSAGEFHARLFWALYPATKIANRFGRASSVYKHLMLNEMLSDNGRLGPFRWPGSGSIGSF